MRIAICSRLAAAALTLAPLPARAADGGDALFGDWQVGSAFGFGHSEGDYGTARNTSVDLGLATLSAGTGNFKFAASIPYMRIDGRGLVVFDAAGNPIVINRRTALPPDTRTGWGDLNLSASYTVPPGILDGFELRVSGVTKVPTASERRRLSTGKADYGFSVDVSRQFGDWMPFVTVGYLIPGQPTGYTLYDTTSVSAGTSLELSERLVATASYDYDSADGPLTPASHSLFGSLSWVGEDGLTLTGYGTAGLSAGSPDMGIGFLVSYGFH